MRMYYIPLFILLTHVAVVCYAAERGLADDAACESVASVLLPEMPVRLSPQGADRIALETLSVTMVDAEGHSAELIGTIHMAEPEYYHAIQKELDVCDTVLYEDLAGDSMPLVCDLRKRAAAGQASPEELKLLEEVNRVDYNPASALNAKARAHRLSRQTQVIDYSSGRFVWADYTYAQIRDILREKPAQPEPKLPQPRRLTEQERRTLSPARQRRHILAYQLTEPVGARYVMQTHFMRERNKRCMQVLDSLPSRPKKLGILFGAMHLPDLVDLMQQRGYRLKELRWFRSFEL